jgi:hypothetical protein
MGHQSGGGVVAVVGSCGGGGGARSNTSDPITGDPLVGFACSGSRC